MVVCLIRFSAVGPGFELSTGHTLYLDANKSVSFLLTCDSAKAQHLDTFDSHIQSGATETGSVVGS